MTINTGYSNYGTNPTWPTDNNSGEVGEYGTDPTWPEDEAAYVPYPREDPPRELSFKEKFTHMKEKILGNIIEASPVTTALGIAGAGLAAAGAAILSGPILVATAIGGAIGAAAGTYIMWGIGDNHFESQRQVEDTLSGLAYHAMFR